MRANNSLFPRSPGSTAGTPLRSAKAPPRMSSRRSALRALSSGPWQAKQFRDSTGRISRLKSAATANWPKPIDPAKPIIRLNNPFLIYEQILAQLLTQEYASRHAFSHKMPSLRVQKAQNDFQNYKSDVIRLQALLVWASLAQLVEHSICNRTVVGSSPTTGSIPHRFTFLTSVICHKHFPILTQ